MYATGYIHSHTHFATPQDALATKNDVAILVDYLQNHVGSIRSPSRLVTPVASVVDHTATGTRQPRSQTNTVNHRSADTVRTQAEIRSHARDLMGRDPDSDTPWMDVPSVMEVQNFALTRRGGPSLVDFRPDLAGSLSSTWNKCLIHVFADDYISKPYHQNKDVQDIRKKFKAHLSTLKTRYLKELKDGRGTQEQIDGAKEDARVQ